MKKLNLNFLILLLFVAFGCNQEDKTELVSNPVENVAHSAEVNLPAKASPNLTRSEATIEACRSEFDSYVESMKLAAKTSGDKEALELVKFFADNAEYLDQLPDTLEEIEKEREPPKFKVVVVYKNDSEPWIGEVLPPFAGASFSAHQRLLLLQKGYSSAFKGTILLHEVHHAKNDPHGLGGEHHHDPWSKANVEAEAYILQERVLRKMLSNKFVKIRDFFLPLVENSEIDVKSVLAKTDTEEIAEFPMLWADPLAADEATKLMNELLGPPESQGEAEMRLVLMECSIVFHLADRYAPNPMIGKKKFMLLTEMQQ